MTDMNDQPAQQPRSGATAGRTTAAAQDAAARPDTAATADTARGYVPRPAPGTTMSVPRTVSRAAPPSG